MRVYRDEIVTPRLDNDFLFDNLVTFDIVLVSLNFKFVFFLFSQLFLAFHILQHSANVANNVSVISVIA